MFLKIRFSTAILINLILIILSFNLSKVNFIFEFSEWLESTVIFILLIFLSIIVIVFLIDLKFLSLEFIFILFSLIFSVSQPVLLFFSYDFGSLTYQLGINIFDYSSYTESIVIAIQFQLFLFLGFIFSKLNTSTSIITSNNTFITNLNNKYTFVLIAFWISLPFKIFIVITQLNAFNLGGYLAVHVLDINPILYIFSLLNLGTFTFIINKLKMNKFSRLLYLGIFLIIRFISFFSGLRAYNLIEILVVLLHYIKHNNVRIKIRYFFYIIPLTYIFMLFLISIRDQRGSGLIIFDLNNLQGINNLFLNLIAEFSFSINVLNKIVFNEIGNPFASQLFTGIISIIPGVSRLFPHINWEAFTIQESLNTYSIGGSYIADAYFDFKNFGIIFAFIYGYMISKVFSGFFKPSLNIGIIYLTPLIVDILFTVRSTTSKLYRIYIWYLILYLIFVYLPTFKFKFKVIKFFK